MYTIAGSGFGLYGYLPAIVRYLEQDVTLPVSYRAKVLARPELSDCVERVSWVEDREQALLACDRLVIALPPQAQVELSERVATFANVEMIVLEKPVADTPDGARQLQDLLLKNGKLIVVNYSFLYTDWYARLRAAAGSAAAGDKLHVQWNFQAHHFTHDSATWKREPEKGGGTIKFFGIHVIAVLAALGYTTLKHSTLEESDGRAMARWSAEFVTTGGLAADVVVDTHSKLPRFQVWSQRRGGRLSYADTADPFSPGDHASRPPGEDRRVPVIASMLDASHGAEETRLYRDVVELWTAVDALHMVSQ